MAERDTKREGDTRQETSPHPRREGRSASTIELDANHAGAGSPITVPSEVRFIDLKPHALGGLGEVLRAFDVELNRDVAIKRLQPRHDAQPESRRRFLAEAEVTARLEHPGIV